MVPRIEVTESARTKDLDDGVGFCRMGCGFWAERVERGGTVTRPSVSGSEQVAESERTESVAHLLKEGSARAGDGGFHGLR